MTDDPIAGKQSDNASPPGPEREVQCRPEDADFQRMLFSMHQHLGKNPRRAPNAKPMAGTAEPRHGLVAAAIRLAPMLVVGVIPFAVLLLIVENRTMHNVRSQILPFLAGCWAIFALWITLAKGTASTLWKNPTGTAWFLLGLLNLVAALGSLLFFLAIS